MAAATAIGGVRDPVVAAQRVFGSTREGYAGGGADTSRTFAAGSGRADTARDEAVSVRVALLSTYPPRACGIGSFSFDLRAALLDETNVEDVHAIAVIDEPSSPQSADILSTVSQPVRGDYTRAARLLSLLDVNVVLLQHEYGIFGGRDGEYVLTFAQALTQPLVVTLHTVLSAPSDHEADVLGRLCAQAELVIVMNDTAKRLLLEMGACDEHKVRVVPHGAPPILNPHRGAHATNSAPRPDPNGGPPAPFRLSTFGLLSSGKGIETMIEAMPAVLERHPNTTYLIAGRTHPKIAQREGERYRLSLERRVLDLGLEDHVAFDDRFLAIEALAGMLSQTDVFVTPYRNREQISSGALTFAIAAGCAAVSTPYWYAEDLLSSGAGVLVPFADPAALADAVCGLISDPAALAAARTEAARVGSRLAWPAVAHATARVLGEAIRNAPLRPPIPAVETVPRDVRTDHLHTLVDDVGIVQHARGAVPNRSSGYCVDDVARLVLVAGELSRRESGSEWTTIVNRAIGFLYDAVGEDGRGMRNFMGYDRRWLDEPHGGDHVGRSIWALGETLSTAWTPSLVGPAGDLLAELVRSFDRDVYLRTAAYAILGLARLDADRLDDRSRALLERLVAQVADAHRLTATPDWSWPEDALTYDNPRLAQALILGGAALHRPEDVQRGLESLLWLGDECGLDEGLLRLPGHRGRVRGEAAPGLGDEQPLDACAFVEAELAAFVVTGEPEHGARAQTAFDWFFGRNRLDRPLYDFATGGCSDGLGADQVNTNQGAESTLAFHRAHLALDLAGLPVVVRRRPAPRAVAA
jgi:glycosyltransferase involved in cell wall biosynthesis